MKKYFSMFLCVALGVLLVASMVTAGTTPGSGIKQTRHDLSTTGGGASFGDTAEQAGLNRICIYCHAPHNTLKITDAAGIKYLPLWNHDVTVQVYQVYNPGPDIPNNVPHQFNGAGSIGQPGGVSRLCLSCHDGTVATNAYGQYASSSKGAADKFITSGTPWLIGGNGDLSNHHPIGFPYAAASVDDEIRIPSTPLTGTKGGVALTINDLLWGGKIECSSCHDVHNTKNNGEKFLWVSDNNSNLCLQCHAKDLQP